MNQLIDRASRCAARIKMQTDGFVVSYAIMTHDFDHYDFTESLLE
jgi:hypothetical protein